MSDHKHGSRLSIQERIRAMNDTLDSVERIPGSGSVVGTSDVVMDSIADDAMDLYKTSPTVPPPTIKRTSVIDMWRKRESNNGTAMTISSVVSAPVQKVAATRKIPRTNPSVLKPVLDEGDAYQETLNDVKTALSLKFTGVASTSDTSARPDSSEEKKDVEREDDELNVAPSPPVSKVVSKLGGGGPMRGVASASPTPPPQPNSNRKSYTEASSPTLPLGGFRPSHPKLPSAVAAATTAEEAPDLTILPASSSASSVGSESLSTTTKRSSKVASIWQKLSNGSGAGTAAATAAVPMAKPIASEVSSVVPPEPIVVNTPPTQKRSVVDIWQKRVSPASTLVPVAVSPIGAKQPRLVSDAVSVPDSKVNDVVKSPSNRTQPQPDVPSSKPSQSLQKLSWTQSRAAPGYENVPSTPSPPSVKASFSNGSQQRLRGTIAQRDNGHAESSPAEYVATVEKNRSGSLDGGRPVDHHVVAVASSPRTEADRSNVVEQEVQMEDTVRNVHMLASEGKRIDGGVNGKLHFSGEPGRKSPSSTVSLSDRHSSGRVADRWKARMDAISAEKAQQPPPSLMRGVPTGYVNSGGRSTSVSSNLSSSPSPSAVSRKVATEPGKAALRRVDQSYDHPKSPPIYSKRDEREDGEGVRQSPTLSPSKSEDSRSARIPASPSTEMKGNEGTVSRGASGKVPLAAGTPPQATVRRGKVTDRYPLSGGSTVSPSFRSTISPIVKDYVVHTPAGMSRNKVAGRWIESKSVAASKSAPVDVAAKTLAPTSQTPPSELGSGTNIIDAWVDSKAGKNVSALKRTATMGKEGDLVESPRATVNRCSEGNDGEAFGGLEEQLSPQSAAARGTITDMSIPQHGLERKNAFDAETVADLLRISSLHPPSDQSLAANEEGSPADVSAIRERWIKRDLGRDFPSLLETPSTTAGVDTCVAIPECGNIETNDVGGVASSAEAHSPIDACRSTPLEDFGINGVVASSSQPDPLDASDVLQVNSLRSPSHSSHSKLNVADRWKKRISRTSYGSDSDAHQTPVADPVDFPLVEASPRHLDVAAPEHNGVQVEFSPRVDSVLLGQGDEATTLNDALAHVENDVSEKVDDLTNLQQIEGGANVCPPGEKCPPDQDSGAVDEGLLATSTVLELPVGETESGLISKFSRDSVASLKGELEELRPPNDALELISNDSNSLNAEGQVGRTCMDDFLQDNLSFIPLSGIKSPSPDVESSTKESQEKSNMKADPPVEPRKDVSELQLDSPLRIIDAWSEKFSAMSFAMNPSPVSNPNDLGSVKSYQIPTDGSSVTPKSTSDGHIKRETSDEIPHEGPISPYQIIDAWSQKSSIDSLESQVPPTRGSPTKAENSVSSDREMVDTKRNEAIVRPANSSAFAPWNSGVGSRSEDALPMREESPLKNKKTFMMLGRRHIVNRLPKKQEDATTVDESAADNSAVSKGIASTDSSEGAPLGQGSNGTSQKNIAAKRPTPPLSLSKEEPGSARLQSNASAQGYHLATPVVSNRRSLDSLRDYSDNSLSSPPSQSKKDVPTVTTSSSSTRKLASDKLSNKKRLQSYRRKASRAVQSEPQPLVTAATDSVDVKESIDSATVDDQESQLTGPTPNFGPFDSSSLQRSNSDAAPTSSHGIEDSSVLRSVRSDSGHTHLSDYDASAFDDICRTSSSGVSSSLANKAEKLLQQRRKRTDQDDKKVEPEHGLSEQNYADSSLHDQHPSRVTSQVAQQVAQQAGEDGPYTYHTDREEVLLDNGRRRLSTRYTTSSRFMDADGSTTSVSAPGMTTDGSESLGSSCVQSTETATSGSDSRFFAAKRHAPEPERQKPRRPNATKAKADVAEEKSVNMSSHSAWDSDWVADVSFDFNKLASVVDEQVAALRGFVGGQAKKPRSLTLPHPKNDPMDVEDVAIEVEYVEDSDDDDFEDVDDEGSDDPEADHGICTAPLDDVKRSLHCSETKHGLAMHFPSNCSEMLPTGQPSFEQKPPSRKGCVRTGYV